MTRLGEHVKTLRLKQSMNVRELAKSAGVSVSYIYAIESGSRGSHVVKLEHIAKALGVSLTELLNGDGDQ